MPVKAAERRRSLAHGESRGFAVFLGSEPRGGETDAPARTVPSPLPGLWRFPLVSHGLRRGLNSIAAPRLICALSVIATSSGCIEHRQSADDVRNLPALASAPLYTFNERELDAYL